ncbi:hypothetical protein EHS13_34220 [Paenibacillus psychroresistens]|uniref:Lipoprotein n=1 Tax=Paenibacillus psychroresistens TaxID=1778678 RepID=A0A6B8RSY6_9BACL|nr:hypothetical protein [Paenibacillus psychroresistens]QGQ99560.1 hypothetical protein EHS13_34220 [Paenibacillus psychroresistens]
MRASVLLICLVMVLVGCASTVQTDYPPVTRLNGHNYHTTIENTSLANIDKELGTVKKHVGTMPAKDFQSNEFPKGSKLFEIKDKDPSVVIAVLINGDYRLLIRMSGD